MLLTFHFKLEEGHPLPRAETRSVFPPSATDDLLYYLGQVVRTRYTQRGSATLLQPHLSGTFNSQKFPSLRWVVMLNLLAVRRVRIVGLGLNTPSSCPDPPSLSRCTQ